MFRYLRHEISECALDLMATHAVGVNATTVLPQCTGVFSKTLGLPCRHQIQESFRNPGRPLRRDDLHPHWWLNPLGDEQPIEPWARIQPPVRSRRRDRPRNPRREPSAFEIAQTQAAARLTQNRAPGRGEGRRNRGGIGRRGVDNLVKGGTLVELKTVIEIVCMRIDPNGEVCVVGIKLRMISLTMNLC